MKYAVYGFLFALVLFGSQAHAACPAAPMASPNDMILRFPASQGVWAGSAVFMADSVLNTATNVEGVVIYDATDKLLKLCNGDDWLPLGGSSGSITEAAGNAGELQFKGSDGQLAADMGLFWNNANKRLGVGTQSPREILHLHNEGKSAFSTSWQSGHAEGRGEWVAYEDNSYMGGLAILGKDYGGASPTENALLWRHALLLTAAAHQTGKIIFRTRNATSYQTAMLIANDGYVGIGTTQPQSRLHITGGMQMGDDSDDCPGDDDRKLGALKFTGTAFSACLAAGWTALANADSTVGAGNAGEVQFKGTDGNLAADGGLFWDNTNKRLGVGAAPTALVGGEPAKLQIAKTGLADVMDLIRYSNNATGVALRFAKSRSNTLGQNGVLQSGDVIGYVSFFGANGTGYTNAAEMSVKVAGAPSGANIPAGYHFFTRNLAGSMGERVVFSSEGNVGIGTPTPQYPFDLSTSTTTSHTTARFSSTDNHNHVSIDAPDGFHPILAFSNNGVLKWRLSSISNVSDRLTLRNAAGSTLLSMSQEGRLGVGMAEPLTKLEISNSGTETSDVFRLNQFSANAALGANIIARRARGTSAAPTAVLQDDVLSGLFSGGYNGSAWSANTGAILIRAAEDFATGVHGTYMEFSTTTQGTIARQVRMTIAHDGKIGIGMVPSHNLTVSGAARSDVIVMRPRSPVQTLDDMYAAAMAPTPTDASAIGLADATGQGLSNQETVIMLADGQTNNDDALSIITHNQNGFSHVNMRVRANGMVGIGTPTPQATLDVGGWARLTMHSAQPIACATTRRGSVALTSSARMCVCDTSNTWRLLNTEDACPW